MRQPYPVDDCCATLAPNDNKEMEVYTSSTGLQIVFKNYNVFPIITFNTEPHSPKANIFYKL
jgi:hypothetical protein